MERFTMAIKTDRDRVRVALTLGSDELMRACLPPPASVSVAKPARALIESLALWMNEPLRVVLHADDLVHGFSLDLTDEPETGRRTALYEVVAVERVHQRRRRVIRLRDGGDFRDVLQLRLFDLAAGGES
jgi:hypothetical protein